MYVCVCGRLRACVHAGIRAYAYVCVYVHICACTLRLFILPDAGCEDRLVLFRVSLGAGRESCAI